MGNWPDGLGSKAKQNKTKQNRSRVRNKTFSRLVGLMTAYLYNLEGFEGSISTSPYRIALDYTIRDLGN